MNKFWSFILVAITINMHCNSADIKAARELRKPIIQTVSHRDKTSDHLSIISAH